MSDFQKKERSHSQPPNKVQTNKSYESDKNSFEELEHNESVDECQLDDLAGYNINTTTHNINSGQKDKKNAQAEEEDGFSSDPLEGFE